MSCLLVFDLLALRDGQKLENKCDSLLAAFQSALKAFLHSLLVTVQASSHNDVMFSIKRI